MTRLLREGRNRTQHWPSKPLAPFESLFTAYFDTGWREIYELFIVGRGAPTRETKTYLDRLSNRFGLEVTYRQYKLASYKLALYAKLQATLFQHVRVS